MKATRKILGIMLSVVLCMCMSSTALAAEDTTIPVTEDGIIFTEGEEGVMPLSSLSGYEQKTITPTDNTIYINCTSSGSGGMGITIKTSCSSGTYTVTYSGKATSGSGTGISRTTIRTNDEDKYGSLYQNNLKQYKITFDVPAGIPSFLAQVWIYG